MKKIFITACIFINLFFSCTSIKQPQNIPEPLDYTNEDVINNEKDTILRLLEIKSVQALWRSYFLNDDALFDKCSEQVLLELDNALEIKDYYEAYRLYTSLCAVGYSFKKDYSVLLQKKYIEEVPGLKKTEKLYPKSIKNCVDATVTIWVDKGFKVENGNAVLDVNIGSGFFIDSRGYIITNYHVIESMVNPDYKGAKNLYVIQPSDTEEKIPATVVGYDSVVDLALLKVDINPEYVFDLGSSSDLEIGDKISVIGTPIGLEGTLTSGIISTLNRKLTIMGSVFQIDAAVNSGNSGGPMIDEKFKVQAIVFAGILQYQGLNFAIPVEYLKQELPLLYNGGNISHTWIGAFGRDYKVKGVSKGLEIQYVLPGGSSHFAKLQEGDLIIEIDNNKVETLEDFQYALLKHLPGTIVKCKYIDSNKKEKTTLIYLDKRPENPAKTFFESDLMSDSFIPLFGMQMTPIDNKHTRSYVITKIIKSSTSDEMGLSVTDPVTVQEVIYDDKNKYILAKIHVKKRTHGNLDFSLILGASYDNPYYF